MNIVILDNEENVLSFLNTEQINCDIVEEEDKLKTLKLEYYPDDEEDYIEALSLFKHGNKVFIYEENSYDVTTDVERNKYLNNNSLFVINSAITYEYYDKNSITVNCEDILVELNNKGVIMQTTTYGTINIEDNVNNWFKPYTTIIKDDLVTKNNVQVQIRGSINPMNLLRKIETITKCKFIPCYTVENNRIIKKTLYLDKAERLGNHRDKVIDIGFNSSNIHYEIDESDCYNAISPIFNINDSLDKVKSFVEMGKEWINLEIRKGDKVAYLLEKPDGEIVPITTITPYYKHKGETYVCTDKMNLDYASIKDKSALISKKAGTVDVSVEKDEADTKKYYLELIFSKCAEALEKKETKKINLEVDVVITEKTKRYNLYDQVNVKIPVFNKIVKAYVSKIEYNPLNLVGMKITLKTNDLLDKKYRETTILNFKNNNNKSLSIGLFSHNGLRLSQKINLVIVKEAETVKVAIKKKNTYKSTGKEAGTITIKAKPSCSYKCGTYKWYTRTWVNRCPFCGSKLSINPKKVKDSELTCKHCKADFCGVCGRDKAAGGSRARLTSASAQDKNKKTKYTTNKVKKVIKGYKKKKRLTTNAYKDLTVPLNLKKGKYTIICYYEGSSEYLPVNEVIKIVIK